MAAVVNPKRGLQIELSVRVSDGSFESRLEFPVEVVKTQADAIVALWVTH